MDISVLGVDLGKNVCSVVGLDASGAVVMRRKVRRETLIALAEKSGEGRLRSGANRRAQAGGKGSDLFSAQFLSNGPSELDPGFRTIG